MIHKIFWDIDECLIHSRLSEPNQNHISFTLDDDLSMYYTIIRPCAQRLIDFSRELVGKDNVYVLTTSTTDYANAINEKAGWGFERDHVIAREEIQRHRISTAYGGSAYIEKKGVASKDNVLIDNLPYRENMGKVNLIGILEDRYLQVREYWGVNGREGDTFEEDVKEFLRGKMDKN